MSINPLIAQEQQNTFIKRIGSNYEKSFIMTLALLYVNGGFKVLYSVALKKIFKDTYGMSPTELQVVEALILFPWDFKILYGIMADTVSLGFFRDTPRRGWLLIFSFIQTLCLISSAVYVFETYRPLMYFFFACSLCGAFMDTVIDGVTCVEQRKDPVFGA